MRKLIIILMIIAFPSVAFGATRYVDTTAGNCSGNYSIASRNCSGSDGYSYSTIQAAVNACNTGDVIYMRGGTYSEIDIELPTSKNGSAWTAGNYTTLGSYPGEWAKVNATGLNTSAD